MRRWKTNHRMNDIEIANKFVGALFLATHFDNTQIHRLEPIIDQLLKKRCINALRIIGLRDRTEGVSLQNCQKKVILGLETIVYDELKKGNRMLANEAVEAIRDIGGPDSRWMYAYNTVDDALVRIKKTKYGNAADNEYIRGQANVALQCLSKQWAPILGRKTVKSYHTIPLSELCKQIEEAVKQLPAR